jgi:murein L,D-transpeptidase YcbB/YkuD
MARPVLWALLALTLAAPASPSAWPGADGQAGPSAAAPPPAAEAEATPVEETPELAALARALAQYQAIAAAGGWPTLPADLRLGTPSVGAERPARPAPPPPTADVLLRLCLRLAIDGDIGAAACDPPVAPDTYDRQLEAAVRRFQARYGLEVDGVIGAATIRELNVPAEARARQIALNAARYRALPDPGDLHVRVNIPAFALALVDHGREVLALRVIAGAVRTPTPEFSATVRGLELRPPWRVPDSIYYGEVLPKLRRDASVLARERYEVLDGRGGVVDPAAIDWRREAGRYRLRQVPGAHNALGLLKFDLPNPHDVYLHDTPGKATFQKHRRAFSHGCIRVQDPLTLAAALMAADPAWPRERLDAAMRGDTSLAVPLPQPVPVHVVYHTVTVEDGDVRFHPDVYSRDVEPAADVPAVGRPVR